MTISYFLGVITGLIITVLVAVVIFRHTSQIKRTIRQAESLIGRDGAIIESESEELADWVDNLSKE